MNSNLTNQKKVFNKNKKKINLSKYLSKIISIKNIKLDSKNTINRKNNEYYSESKSETQNKLLAKKELEIKSLKLKCEQLQEENNKYQLQKNINKKVPNENTSSNFPLKNEIKELWEKFAKIDILNNFIDFEEEPEIIYHIICELFLLSNKLIKEKSESKYKEILKIMGIKNNSIIMKDIESQFKNFIKEHLDEIFKDLENDNYFREYKIKIKNIFKEIIQNKLNNLKNKDEIFKIFCEILEQNDFNEMIKNINDLILIAQYNEPTLYYNIEDFYENLKKIIMPYKGNYSKSSVIIEKEELNNTNLYDKNNNYIIIKNINNKHNLTSCLSQKNNNKNLFNTNEDKKENKVKILKHKNNLLGLLTSRDSREKKIKNGKLEVNKCSSNNKYEKYWRTLNDDNLNYFENFVIKKRNSKANKIISVSNEKVKRMQITNYIHNRGKRNNFGLNEFRNAGKYLASSYNSEDNVIIDKNKFNETNKIKEIKNGNKLINSLKIVNNNKNNSKKYIKKLSRSSKKSKIKIKSNQDSKRYSTNIANENDIITINKFIKKNKKGNLLIGEGNFNNTIDNNNNNLTTNDIKYKIKNFNINYINFGNSGNIVGINNSNIYESKKKIGKDMNSFKNNFLYLPIDDIQKIIETNVKKQNAKFVKNLNNDLFNKISHKNLTNKGGVQEKLSWVKKENSLILCKRESGSNNIIRKKLRNLIEKNKTNIFPQSYVKSKQSKKKFEKYISLNELNNFKKVKSYTINNIEDYSLTNSILNSAKKINNNKTSDILYKQKLYKKTRTNIGIGNDSSPFYIKLLKNKRKNIKNNSDIRKFTLIDIRNGKNKTSKENKLFKNSTNKVKYNKKNDYEKKKENNKSTSNILKNKLINKI